MGQTKELMYETMQRGYATRDQFVCGSCLGDVALEAFVQNQAAATKCDFCGQERQASLAASLGDVIEYMAECIEEEYTDPANELPYETREGGWQGEALDGWDLLEEVGFSVESNELFECVLSAFNDQEWCRRDYFSLNPSERLRHGWETFKNAVKHTRRFTFWSIEDDKSEYDPDYMPVGGMLATIGHGIVNSDLVKTYPKGHPIWRVRVHPASVSPSSDQELSPPPLEKAVQSNRMSPAGIVMFYGAEDFDTASVETIVPEDAAGKCVTGCIFRASRVLHLLDLVDLPKSPSFFTQGSAEYRHTLRFLRHFSTDIAIPVARNGREHIEYVPTQAFTEYVRYELKLHDGAKVDGIRYRSAVNGKPCYVLFCTQDECVASPSSYGRHERWLEFDQNSLRTIDALAAVPEVRRNSAIGAV